MSGLKTEFAGRIATREVDNTTEEGKKAVAEAGFQSHGLVIRDAAGKIVWKQADHEVKMDDVRAALRKLLPPA